MKKIVVLGCGLVGKAIAIDLCRDYDVRIADIERALLEETQQLYPLNVIQSDLSKKGNLISLVKDFDLVICAVPGFMGFQTLKSIIEAGKNVVDISFFEEDPFELDELAKNKNVTAVVDCGVAPGSSNIILGYHNKRMKIDSFKCYVGGLPIKRIMPFQYKAPFSPTDVIEEYLRDARMIEGGKIVVKEALSGSEIIDFPHVGKLEAFYTDGLRSLIKTMNVPDMKEKTLRYPGHIDIIKLLKDTGFFSSAVIDINGTKIKPVDVSSKILFPHWKLKKDEKEFTILRLIIRGEGKEIQYDLFDVFDQPTKTTSMARTTGYTCNAVARLVVEGEFLRKGICPPEFVGEDEKCFEKIMLYLKERRIIYTSHVKNIL
jgi:saccharopine dehydrogenase-like NADP-dependent oxidoreductase